VKNVEMIADESEVCLKLLLPYIKQLLSSHQTDVIAAWYLFDHVARYSTDFFQSHKVYSLHQNLLGDLKINSDFSHNTELNYKLAV
jgi:hypothetical protein